MCNKNSPPPTDPSSPITRRKSTRKRKPITKDLSSSSTTTSSTTSLRNRTTKIRKPKYLSLRHQLSQNQVVPAKHQKTTSHQQPKTTSHHQQLQQPQPQLNLFPLHPENDDKDINVALLFSSDGGATLNGLLEDDSTTTAASEEGSFPRPVVGENGSSNWLVRKAMRRGRSKEEEGSEERWVCYSEVVEEKKELMEEVASYCPSTTTTTSFGSLSLKLDHEGILNAWSDKGSLYVEGGEGPQTVPDFHNDVLHLNNAPLPPNIAWDGGWGSSDVLGNNTWSVPEEDCGASKMQQISEEMGWKQLGQREASVLRYKEKRRNRLFSKKIRYEVRKLNAEKRPRMKGRFVKRE